MFDENRDNALFVASLFHKFRPYEIILTVCLQTTAAGTSYCVNPRKTNHFLPTGIRKLPTTQFASSSARKLCFSVQRDEDIAGHNKDANELSVAEERESVRNNSLPFITIHRDQSIPVAIPPLIS